MNANRGKPRRRSAAWGVVGVLLVLLAMAPVRARETIPAAPQDHFNDYAGIVDGATARRLNGELAQFERDTSNQLVAAIFPRMESASDVADYAVRVAQAWGVGAKGRNNGAVLFVFQESHDIRIVTGYGLEGALPDALCKRIVEDEIVPRFRAGDFSGGMSAGVHAMMAAAKGEYRGTGHTAREGRRGRQELPLPLGVVVVVVVVLIALTAKRRNHVYSRVGRRGVWIGPGSGWGGGGGWSGGGGGGGTFSGGGGSFGGGGAGGKW